MNHLIIIGNLTKDADSKITQSGHVVTSFTVAVNRRHREGQQDQADFFRVTTWDKLAEICKTLTKGKKVAVVGSVSVSTYQTADGPFRASLDVMANEVKFLSPKEQKQEAQKQEAQKSVGFVEVEDDDLPF
jgi:single-strand DNA-binding protein